ncbi:MAG: hypothetical protein HUK09_08475 [Bacteroidaceae bacterium]|nr:hypothetical protein [Bacteroidaceae bacterium]
MGDKFKNVGSRFENVGDFCKILPIFCPDKAQKMGDLGAFRSQIAQVLCVLVDFTPFRGDFHSISEGRNLLVLPTGGSVCDSERIFRHKEKS